MIDTYIHTRQGRRKGGRGVKERAEFFPGHPFESQGRAAQHTDGPSADGGLAYWQWAYRRGREKIEGRREEPPLQPPKPPPLGMVAIDFQ